jgi:hypothetical protein
MVPYLTLKLKKLIIVVFSNPEFDKMVEGIDKSEEEKI